MFTKQLAACLVASTILAAPAFAQNATTAPATAGQAVSGPNGVQFYTQTTGKADWRASKFDGVNIYGSNNEKIGDVKDLIVDHEGMVQAVVIGVGGFLGIGEKNVAVPFKAVEWMTEPMRTASAASGAANTTANNAANSTAMNNGTSAGTAANTNATAMNNSTANSDVTGTTRATTRMAYPDHGVLHMTKDQLKSAPDYKWPDDTRATAQ